MFADRLNKNYGTTIANSLKEKSCVFRYFNFSNYRRLIEIYERLNEYSQNNYDNLSEFWELDKIIDADLVKQIKKLKPPKNLSENIRALVPKITLDSLFNVKEYIDLYKIYKCPLCGFEFNDYELLSESVKEILKQYTSTEVNEVNNLVDECWMDFKRK